MANLHLSEYEDLFEDEGYFFDKDVANLKHLTESDLLKMGITKRGWWMGYKWEYWSERRVYRKANVKAICIGGQVVASCCVRCRKTVHVKTCQEKQFWHSKGDQPTATVGLDESFAYIQYKVAYNA